MRIDILTLFPDTMRAMLGESILGRAQARGLLDIRCHQIRDYTENRQKQVDDYPYGGGWGQVMMAQPLKSCLDAALADSTVPVERRRVIYLSPQGPTFTQAKDVYKRQIRRPGSVWCSASLRSARPRPRWRIRSRSCAIPSAATPGCWPSRRCGSFRI